MYQFVDVVGGLWLTGHFHCLFIFFFFFFCCRVRDGDGDDSLVGAIVFDDIQEVVHGPL